MKTIYTIIESIYNWCSSDDEVEAIAEVIMCVENLVSMGETEVIDEFISILDLKRITPAVMLGVLTVTKHALEYGVDPDIRNKFLKKAEKIMKKELGKERTEKLLELRR